MTQTTARSTVIYKTVLTFSTPFLFKCTSCLTQLVCCRLGEGDHRIEARRIETDMSTHYILASAVLGRSLQSPIPYIKSLAFHT